MRNKINVIFGPTASGKTAYGVSLAQKLEGEIINSDSMQVYKHLQILTAQPEENEKLGIPHHNYGCVEPDAEFSVSHWLKITKPKISDVLARNNNPILVGGTGMYINALVEGLSHTPTIPEEFSSLFLEKISGHSNSELHNLLKHNDPEKFKEYKINDRQRVIRALLVFEYTKKPLSHWQSLPKENEFQREDFHFIYLKPTRDILYNKINKRFDLMLEKGVIEEVRFVVNNYEFNKLPRAHGLPEIRNYILGLITYDEAIEHAKQITRNYAKRQFTWARNQFRFDEIIDV